MAFVSRELPTLILPLNVWKVFLLKSKRRQVVVLDNASIHKSKKVLEQLPIWKKRGLYLQFIPAYSPELNLIERLWKELKYRWLNKPGYFSNSEELKNAIDQTVARIGSKYTVNFV